MIKTHSAVGARMLLELPFEQQELPFVKTASEICRWHHERYDGNGYPDGLKGEQIPIAAQVVGLADVYDALTSKRCYKRAYSQDEALKMIVEGQCGTFHPILIQCLQEVSDRLKHELMDTTIGQDTKSIQNLKFPRKEYASFSAGQQHLQYLYIDSLTGTYNRRYFEEYFQGEEDSEAVVVMDVDNFKRVNDHYGHYAGDCVLQSVAKTISSSIRKTDAVIRYGGDEFVILFTVSLQMHLRRNWRE